MSMSNIEDHEEVEAKALIDQHFIEMTGKPFDMRPAGYLVAVKIYVRPEELKTSTAPCRLWSVLLGLRPIRARSLNGLALGASRAIGF